MSLSICCEISTTWRLLLKRGSISTRRYRNRQTREGKRNSTVVKKPLAKFRVPVNRFVRRVGPRAEAVAFCGAPVPPKSSTCAPPIRTNLDFGSHRDSTTASDELADAGQTELPGDHRRRRSLTSRRGRAQRADHILKEVGSRP